MILLDTDHVSILTVQGSAAHDRLNHRLQSTLDSLGIPIVCLEEQCKGWLAKIHRGKNIFEQMEPYRRLEALFVFAEDWTIVGMSQDVAEKFDSPQKKIRIGTQDLKIAAIALANEALLLSANLRDFRKVPDLRVENWLAP